MTAKALTLRAALLAFALAASGCAARSDEPASATAEAPRVFVQALLVSAGSERFDIESTRFDRVAEAAAARRLPVASIHLFATLGESAAIDTSGPESEQLLLHFAVTPERTDEGQLRLYVECSLADGTRAHTTVVAAEGQPVVMQLENGATLLLQGYFLHSRHDVERLLERKRALARGESED